MPLSLNCERKRMTPWTLWTMWQILMQLVAQFYRATMQHFCWNYAALDLLWRLNVLRTEWGTAFLSSHGKNQPCRTKRTVLFGPLVYIIYMRGHQPFWTPTEDLLPGHWVIQRATSVLDSSEKTNYTLLCRMILIFVTTHITLMSFHNDYQHWLNKVGENYSLNAAHWVVLFLEQACGRLIWP